MLRGAVLLVCFLVLAGTRASAEILTISGTGTVSFVTDDLNIFGANGFVGASFYESISFDTSKTSNLQNKISGPPISAYVSVDKQKYNLDPPSVFSGSDSYFGDTLYPQYSEQQAYLSNYDFTVASSMFVEGADIPTSIFKSFTYQVASDDDAKGYLYVYQSFASPVYTGVGANLTTYSVTVGAVPEPSTWAMMLLGFAGIGVAGYRRTLKSEATIASA